MENSRVDSGSKNTYLFKPPQGGVLATKEAILSEINRLRSQIDYDQTIRLIKSLGKQANGRGSDYRFHVNDAVEGWWSKNGMSANTLYHNFINKNSNLQAWIYVNPVEKRVKKVVKTYSDYNGKTHRKEVWETKYVARSGNDWVIDLDNCAFDSIQRILDLYLTSGLPLPKAISQTGSRNFHIWVTGHNCPTSWTEKNRAAYIMTLLSKELNYKTLNYDIAAERLAYDGVDPTSITKTVRAMNFRVASVKYKQHRDVNKIKDVFATKTWYNPDFFQEMYANGEKSSYRTSAQGVSTQYQENQVVDLIKKMNGLEVEANAPEINPEILNIRYKTPLQSKIENFYARIKDTLDRDLRSDIVKLVMESVKSKKAAEFFANYFLLYRGCLIRKDLRMSTGYIADITGMSKMAISRYIKNLRKAGLIEVMDGGDYIPGQRARRYGVGKVLNDLFLSRANKRLTKQEKLVRFGQMYERGNTWGHFLSDVRFCYYMGMNESQTADLVYEKYGLSGHGDPKTIREIERAWFDFAAVATYPQPKIPKISYEDLMEALCVAEPIDELAEFWKS